MESEAGSHDSAEPSISSRARAKIQSRACEACRRAKQRCQPGPHQSTCKRCSEFKRECVFRTGPRTRRPKASDSQGDLSPPAGPSQTFNITFSIPADEEPSDALDQLRTKHEGFIDDLVPSNTDESKSSAVASALSMGLGSACVSTPGSSTSSRSKPMGDLGIKPQFNLDSAQKLLENFKSMLPYFPCILLSTDANVRSMATKEPFVLLAILAVTSCSSNLQGHSLYDEEFRKVLGLKFVTGGERSLELLQGILIYCAWYPFHLRPKNRQVYQYLKMAFDVVSDQELDREDIGPDAFDDTPPTKDLAIIRAVAACYHLCSVHTNTWAKPIIFRYSGRIARCCDLLRKESSVKQDHLLSWLVSLQHLIEERTLLLDKREWGSLRDVSHGRSVRQNLEADLREWQGWIPPIVSSEPSFVMANLFTNIYLVVAPLMRAPRHLSSIGGDIWHDPIDADRLTATTTTLRTYFDYVLTIAPKNLCLFSSNDWGHLISCVILAFRLCFPVANYPDFNYSNTREILNFGTFLEKLCQEPTDGAAADGKLSSTTNTSKTDASAAFRIVLRSVKAKFAGRLLAATPSVATDPATPSVGGSRGSNEGIRRCPMFDGSMDAYISMWDGHGESGMSMSGGTSSYSHFGTPSHSAMMLGDLAPAEEAVQQNNIWDMMTMDWATAGLEGLASGDAEGLELSHAELDSLEFGQI